MSTIFHGRSRRAFLKTLLGAAGTALFGTGCGVSGPPGTEKVTRHLTGLLEHPEAAAEVGSRYVRTEPAIASLSPEKLTALILQEAGIGDGGKVDASLKDIGRIIKQKVRQDFVNENVVAVDGWLLSRTEARLCALVYLHGGAES